MQCSLRSVCFLPPNIDEENGSNHLRSLLFALCFPELPELLSRGRTASQVGASGTHVWICIWDWSWNFCRGDYYLRPYDVQWAGEGNCPGGPSRLK